MNGALHMYMRTAEVETERTTYMFQRCRWVEIPEEDDVFGYTLGASVDHRGGIESLWIDNIGFHYRTADQSVTVFPWSALAWINYQPLEEKPA